MKTFKHSDETRAILKATLHKAPANPDPLVSSRSLSRGTTIVGLMLEQLGDRRGGIKKPGAVLVRAGSVAWGLVELAAPRSLGQVLFQYWIVLAYALALMMVAAGVFSNSEAVTRAGCLLLGVSLVANIFVEKLRHWMNTGDISRLKPVRFLVPLVLAILACVVLLGSIHAIDIVLDRNGADHRAGALLQSKPVTEVLGTAHTEDNRKLMRKSLEWDTALIPCYAVAFLSLGWLIATHFDRPFRAFALVAATTTATVIFDLTENVQAYIVLTKPGWSISPLYATELKLGALVLTAAILLAQGIVASLEARAARA